MSNKDEQTPDPGSDAGGSGPENQPEPSSNEDQGMEPAMTSNSRETSGKSSFLDQSYILDHHF